MTVVEHLPAEAYDAARNLAARGVGAGDRIAIDSADVLPWLLGADLLGAAALVLEPTWTDTDRAAVLADARPTVTVTGSPEPAPPESAAPAAHPGDTHFYLPTTSGSTGTPKVGVRTRSSWTRSFEALGPVEGPVLIAGPPSASLFLFGALHALWCGVTPTLRAQWNPAEARAAGAVHVVPAMLAELVADVEARPAVPALRTVVCGGAHLGAALRERFARALPHTRLIEYYGSAEHSLIAIRRDGDRELRPVPGIDLDVRDDVLWVRSPLAFDGYLRGGVLETAPEWLSNGDHAEFTASGGLTVTGRGDAVVASGGTQVPAEHVESVLRTVAGVDDALVTGTPHPRMGQLVTAVIEAGAPPTSADLRSTVRAELRPELRPRRWLWTTSLPRTSSGKPARATVAERLRDGTLDARPVPQGVRT